MAVGAFSLWQLARFRCGSWRIFVVAVGTFLLGQLARFCCGSWRVFVVAVGAFSLWQLARFCCGSWRIFVVTVGTINRLSFNVGYIKTGHRATVLLMQKSRMWFLCPVVHYKRG